MPVLNWIGKDAVIEHHNKIQFRFLKCDDSKPINPTQNMLIHGDNLEALKSLIPYYKGKIKCIYIDPPYNTGNEEWVYDDNVNSPKIKQWLGKIVGQEEEDLSRHDKWLCMMYPRLKLLKELLSEDGVICISIDDNEIINLKYICDEIFSEKNLLSILVWDLGTGTQAGHFTRTHEYILIYAKNKHQLKNFSGGVGIIDDRALKKISYKNPSSSFTFSKGTRFDAEDGIELKTSWGGSEKITIVSGRMICKDGKLAQDVTLSAGWALKNQMNSWFSNKETIDTKGQKVLEFYFNKKGALQYRKERTVINPQSVLRDVGSTRSGSTLLNDLLGTNVFNFPKPVELIKKLIEIICDKDSLILDSFAGSGTTGHAIMELNKADGGNRKFILIEMEKEIIHKVTSKRLIKASEMNDDQDTFNQYELGNTLFDKDGLIDKNCTFKQLASHIFFTETQMPIDKINTKTGLIGRSEKSEIYLLHKKILDSNILKTISSKSTKKIIYADKCNLSRNTLKRYNVTFKQIPYMVKIS